MDVLVDVVEVLGKVLDVERSEERRPDRRTDEDVVQRAQSDQPLVSKRDV